MSSRTKVLVTIGAVAAVAVAVIIVEPGKGGPLRSISAKRAPTTLPTSTTSTAPAVPPTTAPTVPASTSPSRGPSTSASSSPLPTPVVTRAPGPVPGATGPATGAAPSPPVPAQSSQSYNYTSTAPAPPSADVPPNPDFTAPCHTPGEQSVCIADTVQAINNAHMIEGVPSMQLPSTFAGLSLPNQLFVLINLERVDRNLSPITGELTSLDQLAQVGAQNNQDPVVPPGGLQGLPVSAWVANWASTGTNVDAVYEWMYNDGLGSLNYDCTTANPSRCWDHRDTILGFQNDMSNYGGSLSFGAATLPTATGNTSVAMVITWSNQPIGGYYSTWSQAVAAGAK